MPSNAGSTLLKRSAKWRSPGGPAYSSMPPLRRPLPRPKFQTLARANDQLFLPPPAESSPNGRPLQLSANRRQTLPSSIAAAQPPGGACNLTGKSARGIACPKIILRSDRPCPSGKNLRIARRPGQNPSPGAPVSIQGSRPTKSHRGRLMSARRRADYPRNPGRETPILADPVKPASASVDVQPRGAQTSPPRTRARMPPGRDPALPSAGHPRDFLSPEAAPPGELNDKRNRKSRDPIVRAAAMPMFAKSRAMAGQPIWAANFDPAILLRQDGWGGTRRPPPDGSRDRNEIPVNEEIHKRSFLDSDQAGAGGESTQWRQRPRGSSTRKCQDLRPRRGPRARRATFRANVVPARSAPPARNDSPLLAPADSKAPRFSTKHGAGQTDHICYRLPGAFHIAKPSDLPVPEICRARFCESASPNCPPPDAPTDMAPYP